MGRRLDKEVEGTDTGEWNDYRYPAERRGTGRLLRLAEQHVQALIFQYPGTAGCAPDEILFTQRIDRPMDRSDVHRRATARSG